MAIITDVSNTIEGLNRDRTLVEVCCLSKHKADTSEVRICRGAIQSALLLCIVPEPRFILT